LINFPSPSQLIFVGFFLVSGGHKVSLHLKSDKSTRGLEAFPRCQTVAITFQEDPIALLRIVGEGMKMEGRVGYN